MFRGLLDEFVIQLLHMLHIDMQCLHSSLSYLFMQGLRYKRNWRRFPFVYCYVAAPETCSSA